jgi:hypothetical protein
MTQELIERSRQRLAFTGLPVILITLSLTMSIVIAATAVSIGIARADTLMPAAGGSGRLMFVLFVAFVIASMGGLTAAVVKNEVRPQRRD